MAHATRATVARAAVALVLAMCAGLLADAAPVAASTAPTAGATTAANAVNPAPKVVIVVGATGSVTGTYRSYADQVYAEAIKYTPNVVKVYSPNATWDAVKTAMQGANVVVYMGHGNGFPSPYRTSPWPYSQNGFGLNSTANSGDSDLQYFGEYYIGNEVKLAPNAVVILNHLCYASGNSEPGYAEPTVEVAMQRADNYGAGFILAGAGAVIADGVSSVVPLITSLFTTHQSLYQAWHSMPNAHGNEFSFGSSRSPGLLDMMDPNYPASGFYRSLVATPDLRTDNIVGTYVPTTASPADTIAPVLWSFSTGPAAVMPSNGTGWTLKAGFSEPVSWQARIKKPDGTTAVSQAGSGSSASVSWDGTLGGTIAPNGAYGWTLDASDPSGNALAQQSGTLKVWAGGTRLFPIAPVRVLDTRNGTGLYSPFYTGIPRTVAVAGRLGIPFGAVAVTGNLTIVGQTSGGYVSLTPAPTSSPSTSTINFPLNDIRANGITVPLSNLGTLSAVFSGASGGSKTELVLDVTGYFMPDATGASYLALDPARVLDTRVGTGLAGVFVSGSPRTFQLAGNGGVPAGATAVTGNLTVTGQTAAGYVALTPVATASPSTSTLNFPVGDNRANNVTMQLGPGGTLSAIYSSASGATTHLIFDVTGYFVPGGSGAGYVPLAPIRLLDTRVGNGLSEQFVAGAPRGLIIAGRGGVPAGVPGVTGNLTVVIPSGAGYLSVTPSPTSSPTTSTINFPAGDIRANGVDARLASDGSVAIVYMGSGTTDVVLDVTGFFLVLGP